jgi:hypothetical protein
MNLVLAVVVALTLISLWRVNLSENYKNFNLIDLVTNGEGRIHRPALQEFGVFVVMSWGFILLINKNALTEWYVGIYVAAFVIRAAHSAYLRSQTPKKDTP